MAFIAQVHATQQQHQMDLRVDYQAFYLWRFHREELEARAASLGGTIVLPGYPYQMPKETDDLAWGPLWLLRTAAASTSLVEADPSPCRNQTEETALVQHQAALAAIFEHVMAANHN